MCRSVKNLDGGKAYVVGIFYWIRFNISTKNWWGLAPMSLYVPAALIICIDFSFKTKYFLHKLQTCKGIYYSDAHKGGTNINMYTAHSSALPI